MKFSHLLIAVSLAVPFASAEPEKASEDAPLLIRPPKGDMRKSNEVIVVLDPPSDSAKVPLSRAQTPLLENPDALSPDESDKPPEPPAPEPAPSEAEASAHEAPPATKPNEGVTVRVEKLQTTSGPVDPAKVKLLAPFPAKPLSSIPSGWKLDANSSAPPFNREVEIAPGSKISLSIRPHVLVPETNGSSTFTVTEPGYQSELGYGQKDTVGAVLATSVRQLDDDSRQMGIAIDNLQQLLISLPSPAPVEPPPPVAKPVKNP
jgi:hypothetical protein